MNKRSIVIAGHATSLWIEDEFWTAIKEIAQSRSMSLGQLVAQVDASRDGNLSSALRLLVLRHYRDRAAAIEGAPVG